MVIPDKSVFIKEVEEITDSKETREKLIKLYDHSTGYEKTNNANKLIHEVLKELFGDKFSADPVIPYKFLGTNIAKVVFSIMYNLNENLYSMEDLIELAKAEIRPEGYTRQYLGQEIRDGKLKGTKKGKVWWFTEEEVREYFDKKKAKK